MAINKQIFTLLLLLTLTIQLNLIPERNTGIFIENASDDLFSEFNIRFSFQSGINEEIGTHSKDSPGLNYKQFFGVKFPLELGESLNFHKWDKPKFECSLSDETRSYLVTAVISSPSDLSKGIVEEKSTAYCRIDEPQTNLPLKIGPEYIYRFKIKFNLKIPTKFIHQISFFTSTSNNPEKMIIDYIPVLGNAIFYNNWKSWRHTDPLEMVTANFVVKDGVYSAKTGNKIYPYVGFDLKLQLKCNEYMSMRDYMIIINYPSNTVSPGKSVRSLAVDQTQNLKKALDGNLDLKKINQNSLFIEGIVEDLVPNREFVLEFPGWKALDTDVGNERDLEVVVYYKNTYSVFSFSSSKVFLVEPLIIDVTANHPEFWDIYRNGAWPTSLKITLKNKLEKDGGYYFVIQHENALTASQNDGNIITFIASTCDFSEDSKISNDIGVRPSCFPLRLDHNYPDQNSLREFTGSGIFFYLKGPFEVNTQIILNVWIYADNCGGYNFNNFAGNAFSVPKFRVSIFSDMNTNQINEKRFDTKYPFIQKIAEGSKSFDGKCWNNKVADFEPVNSIISKYDNYFKKDYLTDDDLFSQNDKRFTVKFREVFVWKIADQTKDVCTGCFSENINTGIFTEKYLYSSKDAISNQSNFLASAEFTSFENDLFTVLPNGYMANNAPNTGNDSNINGRLTILFSKKWFIGTTFYKFNSSTPCYLSWACSQGTGDMLKLSKNISSNSPSTGKNYIASKRGSSATKTEFDEKNSNLNSLESPNSRSNIMKLVSEFYDGNNNWQYIENIPTDGNFKFAWFTNCIKWNASAATEVKSLYTYIDIQFIWSYAELPTNPSRVFSNIRLIKLFPEGGVFQDFSKFDPPANPVPVYLSHYVIAENSDYSPVCLLEIDGFSLNNVYVSGSDSFVLFIGMGSILETDYTEPSSVYPVAPLKSSISVYGLQSQNSFHFDNLYVSDDYPIRDLNNKEYEYPPLHRILWSIQSDFNISGEIGQSPIRGNNKSIYHFLMGSVLIFKGAGNGNMQGNNPDNFYVPYYCNYSKKNAKSENRVVLNNAPTLFGAWTSIESYDKVFSFNSYLRSNPDSDSFSVIMSALKNIYNNNTFYKGFLENNSSIEKFTTSKKTATLRWNAYTDNLEYLNVYNKNRKNNNNIQMTCTGFSLFFNDIISLEDTVSGIFNDGQKLTTNELKVFTSSKFYVMGKSFSKAIFMVETDILNNMNTNGFDQASPFYLSGVKRPDIQSFINNGELVVSDKVAFSCVSAFSTHYDALTNYFYDSVSGTSFVLDWADISENWEGEINWDKDEISKQDFSGNFNLNVTTPYKLPVDSHISFKASSSFNNNTICGIKLEDSNYANDCENNSGVFSCKTPYTSQTFNICCYNIFVGDSIKIDLLSASLNTEPKNLALSDYIKNDIYSTNKQLSSITHPFQFASKTTDLEDIIGTKYASIKEVSYHHTSSEEGIGKISFTISLPRELARDMKISIMGDMNGLLVPGAGNFPRCVASVSNANYGMDWADGDILINNCSTHGIKDGNPITINTKRMIYKCGVNFSKELSISLWPVRIKNWETNNKNQFIVKMQLNSLDDIALNSEIVKIPKSYQISQKPKYIGQWDTLCRVTSIIPRTPSEKADYTFEFDLDTHKVELLGTNPNELTIFFPYEYYGSIINNVVCYYESILDCSFMEEGILNIKFPKTIPVGTGSNIAVIISGILNPEINFDYSFPCSINETDFVSSKRYNLITGSGKMKGGITEKNIIQKGGLILLNAKYPISNNNPRYTSTHTFRITFDNAINFSSSPSAIKNPIIYINFPDEYNLYWYINKPTAIIKEYTEVYESENKISATSEYIPDNIKVFANKIIIYLGNKKFTFKKDWKFWEIILTNIVNPANSTKSQGPPKTQGTGSYVITLTSEDESIYFTTFSNSNSFASNLIEDSELSNTMWSRGNVFENDFEKWVVDFYSDKKYLNKLKLRAGRYSIAFMEINIPENIKINLSSTIISLLDPIFSTDEDNYNLTVSKFSPLKFLIGCSCNTPVGHYLLNFKSSESELFAPLSPVIATVSKSTKATIKFDPDVTVPVAGSHWLEFFLSEPNYDTLNIKWDRTPSEFNEETANLSEAKIYPTKTFDFYKKPPSPSGISTFSIITPRSFDYPQKFHTKDPNECYTFPISKEASFKIKGDMADLYLISPNSLIYSNSDVDTKLPKNSVKFEIFLTSYPLFIECSISCFSGFNLFHFYNNPYFYQNYTTQIKSSIPITIRFDNLIRNENYFINCKVETTNGDDSIKKEKYLFDFDSRIIIPSKQDPTECFQLNYMEEISNQLKISLINYCQKYFSSQGWYENGCIVCTDGNLTNQAPGLDIAKNRSCPSDEFQPNFQAPPFKSSFTVCPIPHPACPTDVKGGYKKTFDDMVDTINTKEKFESKFGKLDVKFTQTYSVLKINDNYEPNIQNLNVRVISYNKDGEFKMSATYPSPILCYWKISKSTGSVTLPEFNQIKYCYDNSWCGLAQIGPIESFIQNYDKFRRIFQINSTYNVYFACQNYIPFAEKESVVKLIEFSVNKSTKLDHSNTIRLDLEMNDDLLIAKVLRFSFISLIFIFMNLF